MTVMVGGRDAAFAHCRPLFEAIAKNVFHVGPSGAGCAAKLVTQYLGYTNFIAALEGMLVAAKAGIDLGVLARIVPVSAGQSRTFDNIPRGVLTGTFISGGTLDIVAKDIDLACQLAREVGAPAALGRARLRHVQAGPGAGLGQEGFPVVARVLEAMAGTELRDQVERAMDERRRIDRLLLAQEIAEFLYREAELLDERRHDDWLALLADDIRYWMPMRRNVKYGEDEREFTRDTSDINWFDEGKETLDRRVKQIETGIHWAEEPVSRISHLVSNVQMVEATPVVADAARGHGQMPLPDLPQPGRDRDRHPGRQARGLLRREGDDWRIARRKIILDQNVLLSKNLTFFF